MAPPEGSELRLGLGGWQSQQNLLYRSEPGRGGEGRGKGIGGAKVKHWD